MKYLAIILCLIPSLVFAEGYGFREIDGTLTFTVNTHASATGAATDADSVPSYRVYEDETGTAILTGSMAKLDDANTTGFYSEQLTLSAANGFEAGKSYSVYVSATVSSVTSTISHNFTIVALATEESIVDEWETQSQADPTGFHVNLKEINGDATAVANAESMFDGSGYGPVMLRTTVTTVNSQTNLTLASSTGNTNNLLGSTVIVRDVSVPANFMRGEVTSSDGDTIGFTLNGATATFTIVTGDVVEFIVGEPNYVRTTSILADTNEVQTDLANGGRLDLIFDATLADTNELQTDWANGGRLDVIVDSILDDTSTGVAIADGYLTEAKFGAGLIFDPGTDTVTVGSLEQAALAQFLSDDTGETVAAAGSVGLLSQGAGDSAGDIADAVLDEALSGHTTAGTLGKAISDTLADTSLIGAPVDEESISGMIVSLRGVADNIETQTAAGAIRTALGMSAADLDTQLDGINPAAETRDLRIASANRIWRLVQKEGGVESANTPTLYQGDSQKFSFDCRTVLEAGDVMAGMAEVASSETDLTATEVGVGPTWASVQLTAAADCTPGTYTVTCEIETDDEAGPITLVGYVKVVARP